MSASILRYRFTALPSFSKTFPIDDVPTYELCAPPPYPFAGDPQEARTTSSTGKVSTGGVESGFSICSTRARPAASPMPSMSWRIVVRGGGGGSPSFMLSEAANAEVVGNRKAGGGNRPDGPAALHVGP